ncbi:MAG: ATP-binding cassette domain-containing protein, partial [Clostridiales Family XIII bacterium]|nr:ATP-binding cassette domain-containing protein [Clostridiales Family XIII bacterium]
SLSLDVREGEIVSVVGSSGSGKSLLAHAVLGILPGNARTAGGMFYFGQELTPALQQKLRGKEIVLIPQSVDCLDPLMKVGKQVVGVHGGRRAQRAVFERYGLEPRVEKMFPFQLSGGMARRILVATAVTTESKLIVADEPTPGLSEDLAMETLRHFRELADGGAAVLLITHDIDLSLNVADRIAVFYAGAAVEIASAGDFGNGDVLLRHPYSKALIDALPQNAFRVIPGTQPYAGHLSSGCSFAARCAVRTAACDGEIAMRDLRGGKVRCVNAS